jgi:hypothetical protein
LRLRASCWRSLVVVILVSSAATISMTSPIGMPLISYFICCSGGSLTIPGPVPVSRSALAKLWMWARSRTRIDVWAGTGDSGGSSRCGGIDEEPAAWRWAEFHRGPLSESGEGMDLEGGGITVVAVLADDALETEAGKDPGAGSSAPSWGISCCGCVPPDDGCDEADEDGGEGSRATLSLVDERLGLGCFAVPFSCGCSSRTRRLGVWFCAPVKDVEVRRGLAVGRGVWWDWASRSRDLLADRLW